ncbi:MAG: hypothetical protein EOO77_16815 [Oxalobacteraceae bacterium]|nr:MAG: hypothetical protein EOO77_16815 [Oxalobacteraceae bacterium]
MNVYTPRLVTVALAAMLTTISTGASAQGFEYDCQNKPVKIEIPGGRLDGALKQLRLATRCAISGTKLARGKRSKPLVGMMTPEQALQAMLNGTGLEGNSIKGGLEITRIPR